MATKKKTDLSAALKKGCLDDAHYAAMLASTTQLNTPGIALGRMRSASTQMRSLLNAGRRSQRAIMLS